MHCPKCDADITDSYEGADPDTGILVGGWYCDDCDYFLSEADVDDGSDDARLDTPKKD